MSIRAFAFAMCAPLVVLGGLSDPQITDRMCRDIDVIQNTFNVKYAPAEWKKRYAGWDLNTEIELTKDRVRALEEPNVKNYQRTIRQFFQSTKDYHVGVLFWSTERATLPFRVCGAEGKYYITYIDRARLPLRSFPFLIGDELVLFDGHPTDDVVQELRELEVGDASPDTDQALAEIYLTMRTGMQGLLVPKGPVTIGVRSAKTGSISSYQIIWDHDPEKIKELPFKALDVTRLAKPTTAGAKDNTFFQKKMTVPFADALMKTPLMASPSLDPNELGERKSFVPQLGKILWQTEDSSPFYAYLFEDADKRKIGYIRIPHYSGGAVEVEAFASIIAYLERHSSALVIDQVNNPGGSVFYLYGLASLLTDQPLYTPKHRMTITQEDVAYALEYINLFEYVKSDDDARLVLGDTMEGYPVNYQTSQFMLNFFRFIIDEWGNGHTLTNPYYLYGVDWINSHHDTRYTKPILLLVNRLCFSGGDFLPAIMQDNKRVTVFGAKTAGAGGYVDGFYYHNPFGVAYVHYTASIAERIDNNPIENLGVTPDIAYDITAEDLRSNFSGYRNRVLEALKHLR